MNTSTAGLGLREPAPWRSRRSMDLWDMINWSLDSFLNAVSLVRQSAMLCTRAVMKEQGVAMSLDPQIRELTLSNLRYVRRICVEQMMMESVEDRFGRIYAAFQSPALTHAELLGELNTLLQAIEDDARKERFYHYPRPKGSEVVLTRSKWLAALQQFKSAEQEIEAGVDCYGLGHNTAAIFHMMRVAEHGLRALARERQVTWPTKPLEWATWQDMLNKIEGSARTMGKIMAPGPQKDAALAFYTGAMGQFYAFKDQYRNAVMHVRASYDEHQALSAITHVRDFMNGLSAKIGEKTRRQIRKWP